MAEEFAVDPFAEYRTRQECKVALAREEEEPTIGGRFVLRRRFKYLVELCGNLLLVEVEKSGRENVTSAYRCEVFQLDGERKRWDRIVSLGDWILFVGMYCKFSAPAVPGVEGNCVVFIFPQGFEKYRTLEEAFVLNLSSGMIVPLNHRPDLLQLFSPPSFFYEKRLGENSETDGEINMVLFRGSSRQTCETGSRPTCKCGEIAVLMTSLKPWSCGRRFFGCPFYDRRKRVHIDYCNFFLWVDREPDSNAEEVLDNTIVLFERKCEKMVEEAISRIVKSVIVIFAIAVVVILAIVKAAV